MECKFRQVDRAGAAKVRINRYIMECKLGTTVDKIGNVKELIDTLWNVNEDTAFPFITYEPN